MHASSCPLCGLTVPHDTDESLTWRCPRCLARSSGALSVALEPVPAPRRPRLPRFSRRLLRPARRGSAIGAEHSTHADAPATMQRQEEQTCSSG